MSLMSKQFFLHIPPPLLSDAKSQLYPSRRLELQISFLFFSTGEVLGCASLTAHLGLSLNPLDWTMFRLVTGSPFAHPLVPVKISCPLEVGTRFSLSYSLYAIERSVMTLEYVLFSPASFAGDTKTTSFVLYSSPPFYFNSFSWSRPNLNDFLEPQTEFLLFPVHSLSLLPELPAVSLFIVHFLGVPLFPFFFQISTGSCSFRSNESKPLFLCIPAAYLPGQVNAFFLSPPLKPLPTSRSPSHRAPRTCFL